MRWKFLSGFLFVVVFIETGMIATLDKNETTILGGPASMGGEETSVAPVGRGLASPEVSGPDVPTDGAKTSPEPGIGLVDGFNSGLLVAMIPSFDDVFFGAPHQRLLGMTEAMLVEAQALVQRTKRVTDARMNRFTLREVRPDGSLVFRTEMDPASGQVIYDRFHDEMRELLGDARYRLLVASLGQNLDSFLGGFGTESREIEIDKRTETGRETYVTKLTVSEYGPDGRVARSYTTEIGGADLRDIPQVRDVLSLIPPGF